MSRFWEKGKSTLIMSGRFLHEMTGGERRVLSRKVRDRGEIGQVAPGEASNL